MIDFIPAPVPFIWMLQLHILIMPNQMVLFFFRAWMGKWAFSLIITISLILSVSNVVIVICNNEKVIFWQQLL